MRPLQLLLSLFFVAVAPNTTTSAVRWTLPHFTSNACAPTSSAFSLLEGCCAGLRNSLTTAHNHEAEPEAHSSTSSADMRVMVCSSATQPYELLSPALQSDESETLRTNEMKAAGFAARDCSNPKGQVPICPDASRSAGSYFTRCSVRTESTPGDALDSTSRGEPQVLGDVWPKELSGVHGHSSARSSTSSLSLSTSTSSTSSTSSAGLSCGSACASPTTTRAVRDCASASTGRVVWGETHSTWTWLPHLDLGKASLPALESPSPRRRGDDDGPRETDCHSDPEPDDDIPDRVRSRSPSTDSLVSFLSSSSAMSSRQAAVEVDRASMPIATKTYAAVADGLLHLDGERDPFHHEKGSLLRAVKGSESDRDMEHLGLLHLPDSPCTSSIERPSRPSRAVLDEWDGRDSEKEREDGHEAVDHVVESESCTCSVIWITTSTTSTTEHAAGVASPSSSGEGRSSCVPTHPPGHSRGAHLAAAPADATGDVLQERAALPTCSHDEYKRNHRAPPKQNTYVSVVSPKDMRAGLHKNRHEPTAKGNRAVQSDARRGAFRSENENFVTVAHNGAADEEHNDRKENSSGAMGETRTSTNSTSKSNSRILGARKPFILSL